MIIVIVIAWIPMPSPARALVLVSDRVEEAGDSTMNEAPRREPDSIENASSFVIVPAPKRLIAVAATGEPESTK